MHAGRHSDIFLYFITTKDIPGRWLMGYVSGCDCGCDCDGDCDDVVFVIVGIVAVIK